MQFLKSVTGMRLYPILAIGTALFFRREERNGSEGLAS
jgi:hypothetical protein